MFPSSEVLDGHMDLTFDTYGLFYKALAMWRFRNNENFAPI